MSNKVRKHIYLTGRVQGVGFRAYILSNAQMLHLTGWVKNLLDGRVEAVFAGDKDKVEKIIDIAKEGPTWGKVTDIEIIEEEYKDEFDSFKVRY